MSTKSDLEGTIVSKLPKNPVKGSHYRLRTKRGVMSFEATGKKGFGMWRITKRK